MTRPRPPSRWWSRSRGLPATAYRDWQESLSGCAGCPARILAWAAGERGPVVASPAVLSWSEDGSWTHLGWHRIEHGTWNAELRRLSWVLTSDPDRAAGRGAIQLAEPARLPEVFRERIAATVVLQQFVPVREGAGVTVTARRDLAAGGAISWHAAPTRGVSWRTPGLREAAEAATARLRAEYDVA